MSRHKDKRDHERLAVLRQMLEDRRREIKDKLRSLRETLPAEVVEVKDAEEQSVADFIQDVDFALMEMKSATLLKIDEALLRVERGSYGICEECALPIADARLKAVPFADLCRDCQEQEEYRERDLRERIQHADARLGGDLLPRR